MKRLRAIQTSVWMPVIVREYRWCHSHADARLIEGAVHEALRDASRLLFGEWFDIRAEEAADVLEEVALLNGLALGKGVPAGRDDISEHLQKIIDEGYLRRSMIWSQTSSVADPNPKDECTPIYGPRGQVVKI